ncbi:MULTISPECIES: class I SAM-dependent methyltransferase [Sutcliffiella]|uniref:SAM-dependent methyltransferase n=1 Tax=Sutcliffiella cohnii TaxID=33932 RepID=A0A223KQ87_9BACI|nr:MULTISPECIES: class I SAM-dependent methyltransferase [Sutcliffiella]AST91642.1 SAM-dependent methyltransferase [Sutcliffiella cohnii]MED4014771.1 class I SAM-dependent methyltransferase [Sutcliffiella cohnii]WBL12860.1 class I SAM-dependent methyltransferase [Sutcliffiella sp. NC1]
MFSFYSKLSSEVYDIDKPVGHSFGDIEYYMDRLKNCNGKILEPATGTGRILIPLLQQGFKVEGFDVSEEMLSICQKNCEENGVSTKLFIDRMESFTSDSKYEAIIVPTGTFLLLFEREESLRALKNFYNHLQNNGKLIIDIHLPDNLSLNDSSERYWELSNGEIITLRYNTVKIDYVKQYSISHGRYEKWRNGKLIQTELEQFPIRWYGVEEFKMILEKVGFEDIVISANYKYGKYPTNNEDTITFEATVKKLF